jgi:hypothetical protein
MNSAVWLRWLGSGLSSFFTCILLWYILAILQIACLYITPGELKDTEDFTVLLSKISTEVDSEGRPFLDWDSSISFYQNLVTEYPYLVRELKNIGATANGENLYALHMSYKYTSEVDSLGIADRSEFLSDEAKPSVIIIGGHLGNSMVAHTYIFSMIAKLIHSFHHGELRLINLLKLRHIWLVPFLNVDTYKYIQSYSGSISDVQFMVKNRKSGGSWNILEIGVNLLNNYGYKWGEDNFGSSNVECLSRYRGASSLSESETQAIITLFESTNSPTLVLGIESSENYIKYPFNYVNDATNNKLAINYYAWFYTSLVRDTKAFDLGISTGNYVSLFKLTNNGDNDDYFRDSKHVMSYTWNIGHRNYGTLHLNETTSDKVSNILTSNLDLGIYAIEKAGEQISVTVNFFNVCTPPIEEWDGFEPDNGMWKFYINLNIFNSGINDLVMLSEVSFGLSNSRMYFQGTSASNSRRNLANSVTIEKTTFYGKEEDVIKYKAFLMYDSKDDPLQAANSIGNLVVSLTYYGSTVTLKNLKFSSYREYKDTLDEYYYSRIKRATFIVFTVFCVWVFFHSIFLFLQLKFDIISLIKQRIKKKTKTKESLKAETPSFTTKDDHMIMEQVTNDQNLTVGDRTLKESISKSNTELIPKVIIDAASLRFSKEKPLKDDSGEIWEYQDKGTRWIKFIEDEMSKRKLKNTIEPVPEEPSEEDSGSPRIKSDFNKQIVKKSNEHEENHEPISNSQSSKQVQI